MSLYNMICGMNANLAVLASPFLPRAADRFPRFRDVFTAANDAPCEGDLFVYTRMGGGNRTCWNDDDEKSNEPCDCYGCDADRLEQHPDCVARYDDDFDSTFCTFVFVVPLSRRPDFDLLMAGQCGELSEDYRSDLRNIFSGRDKIQSFIDDVLGDTREWNRLMAD